MTSCTWSARSIGCPTGFGRQTSRSKLSSAGVLIQRGLHQRQPDQRLHAAPRSLVRPHCAMVMTQQDRVLCTGGRQQRRCFSLVSLSSDSTSPCPEQQSRKIMDSRVQRMQDKETSGSCSHWCFASTAVAWAARTPDKSIFPKN
jgi:hypothetical protein